MRPSAPLPFRSLLLLLAFASPRAGAAQCATSQGNADLFLSGLARLGNAMSLGLSGRALSPFVIWVGQSGSCNGPWGQICLSCASLTPLVGGQLPSGPFVVNFSIPRTPSLVGASILFQGAVVDDGAPNGQFAISNLARMTVAAASVTTVYFEDFEAGQGLWSATNGVWQVGTPTNVGPQAPWSGRQCAATNLSGRYPPNQNTTLVSRPITLPSAAAGEEIALRYRLWFDLEDCCDGCQVLVNGAAVPGVPGMSGANPTWVQAGADLTPYAGQTIRLGFRLQSNGAGAEGAGAYIDDVHVFVGRPDFRANEDWERGLGDWWWADNGMWEVGTPATGCAPHSGTQCADTRLAGHYAANANTRLISPTVTLGSAQLLAFWECFEIERCCDAGQVQVSELQSNGTWSAWANLGSAVSGSSAGWSQRVLDLSPLAGRTVRFALLFVSNGPGAEGPGWLVDDLRLF